MPNTIEYEIEVEVEIEAEAVDFFLPCLFLPCPCLAMPCYVTSYTVAGHERNVMH